MSMDSPLHAFDADEWGAILGRMKLENPTLAALASTARYERSGEHVLLSVPFAIHYAALSNPERKQTINDFMSNVLEEDITLDIYRWDQ